MAKKITYASRSSLSISINLLNGNKKRIEFHPQSDGSSLYKTDDVDIQEGLSKHYLFGELFNIRSVEDDSETASVDDSGGYPEDDNEKRKNATSKDETTDYQDVEISGLADAREYLADHYGIDKTSLKSKSAILAKAKELNINFAGIE